MPQIYTLSAVGVTLPANKVLLGFFNGVGSGRIVRLYRVWVLNNQTVAIAGALTTLELRRTTTGSGGTAITPVKHDSQSESFPAELVTSSNMSVTTTSLLMKSIWSADEPAQGTISIDELQTIPSLNMIFDTSYTDANVEPIVCREGYGVCLLTTVANATAIADVFMEVSLASS